VSLAGLLGLCCSLGIEDCNRFGWIAFNREGWLGAWTKYQDAISFFGNDFLAFPFFFGDFGDPDLSCLKFSIHNYILIKITSEQEFTFSHDPKKK
jgi:hypothetical protein